MSCGVIGHHPNGPSRVGQKILRGRKDRIQASNDPDPDLNPITRSGSFQNGYGSKFGSILVKRSFQKGSRPLFFLPDLNGGYFFGSVLTSECNSFRLNLQSHAMERMIRHCRYSIESNKTLGKIFALYFPSYGLREVSHLRLLFKSIFPNPGAPSQIPTWRLSMATDVQNGTSVNAQGTAHDGPTKWVFPSKVV